MPPDPRLRAIAGHGLRLLRSALSRDGGGGVAASLALPRDGDVWVASPQPALPRDGDVWVASPQPALSRVRRGEVAAGSVGIEEEKKCHLTRASAR